MRSPSSRTSESAQKCGGVQKKMMRNIQIAVQPIVPVTAAQPISTGTAPAAPPITILCGVLRLSHMV